MQERFLSIVLNPNIDSNPRETEEAKGETDKSKEYSSISAVKGNQDDETNGSIEIDFEQESETTDRETRPTIMTRNTRFTGALKDMEWFGESPTIWNLGKTRSESQRLRTQYDSDLYSGPYYTDVVRENEEKANLIIEALTRSR